MKSFFKWSKKRFIFLGILLLILLWICSYPIFLWLFNHQPQSLRSVSQSNKIIQLIETPPLLAFVLLNNYVLEPLEIKNIQKHFNKVTNIAVQKVESNDDGEIGATIVINNHLIFVGNIDANCFTNCSSMNFYSASGSNPYFSIRSSIEDLSQKKMYCNYPPGCDSSKVTIRVLPFMLHNYQEFFDNFDKIYDIVTRGKEGVDYHITNQPSDYVYSFYLQ